MNENNETKAPKIEVYATSRHGEGNVQLVGTYSDWDDIEIRTGHFQDDIVLTFNVVENE